MTRIGERIRDQRILRAMYVEPLAAQLHVPARLIVEIEFGEKYPSENLTKKLIQVLGEEILRDQTDASELAIGKNIKGKHDQEQTSKS